MFAETDAPPPGGVTSTEGTFLLRTSSPRVFCECHLRLWFSHAPLVGARGSERKCSASRLCCCAKQPLLLFAAQSSPAFGLRRGVSRRARITVRLPQTRDELRGRSVSLRRWLIQPSVRLLGHLRRFGGVSTALTWRHDARKKKSRKEVFYGISEVQHFPSGISKNFASAVAFPMGFKFF